MYFYPICGLSRKAKPGMKMSYIILAKQTIVFIQSKSVQIKSSLDFMDQIKSSLDFMDLMGHGIKSSLDKPFWS